MLAQVDQWLSLGRSETEMQQAGCPKRLVRLSQPAQGVLSPWSLSHARSTDQEEKYNETCLRPSQSLAIIALDTH